MEEKLKTFIKLLEEENRALIEAFNDKESALKLKEIIQEKEQILLELLKSDKEELKKYKNLLEIADNLTKRNALIAQNGIEFANSIFEAIFKEEVEQYNPNGKTAQQKNFINKKI